MLHAAAVESHLSWAFQAVKSVSFNFGYDMDIH